MHQFALGTRADMEWLRGAACVGEDPELFFPVGTTGPALRDIAAAKRVCARCPVTPECLAFALDCGQTSGADLRLSTGVGQRWRWRVWATHWMSWMGLSAR
ncbi:Transcriptional regulator WhiB [Streptomyces alboniger]